MENIIKFDCANNLEKPTIVLALKSGKIIGNLNPIQNLYFEDIMTSPSNFSFSIDKTNCYYWDDIKNFRCIWIPEWDKWYEIYVDVQENLKITKNISATHLPQAELSQLKIHNVEINTEKDIERDDYVEPTIFFDEHDPSISLLHRVVGTAVNFVFGHIDESLKKIQRTFSFNDEYIYDALEKISEEIHCLFVFNSYTKDGKIVREISAYDLESNCLDCGLRDEFNDKCPNCGSKNIITGYGEDTPTFLSVENVLDDIQYSTNVDSVKNCFKLEAGDDLMTATIINCNPNGAYIWNIDSFKNELSDELYKKIDEYEIIYKEYSENKEYCNDIKVSSYNDLINKYESYNKDNNGNNLNNLVITEPTNGFQKINIPVIGYQKLVTLLYDVIDMGLFLESNLMPFINTIVSETSAEEQATIVIDSLSSVSVTETNTKNETVVKNAVLSMAKVIIDSRYKIEVSSSELNTSYEDVIWCGTFTITNLSNEDDKFITDDVYIVVANDYETFIKQKIEKTLAKEDDSDYGISSLFKFGIEDFNNEIKKYSLNLLQNLSDCCEGALSILTEQGLGNPNYSSNTIDDGYTIEYGDNLNDTLYVPFYQKQESIQSEIAIRNSEINIITELEEYIGEICKDVQNSLDLQQFVGTDLWKELNAYRRDDTFSNNNYISDGLTNAELLNNANEFIKIANKEIKKSSTLQHSITVSLKNIFTIKDFESLRNNLIIGNWIRVLVNNQVYKMRLIGYKIDYNDWQKSEVTFSDVEICGNDISDVKNLIANMNRISSSYEYVERQVSKNTENRKETIGLLENGLDISKTKILDDAENQNMVSTSYGTLYRKKKDYEDSYEDEQLKIINSSIFMTNDGWKTVKTGLGKFIYYNPTTKQYETGYGIIADTICSNLILSKEVGIYNEDSSVEIGENGIVITTDKDGKTRNVFLVRKKSLNSNNDEIFSDQLYIDNDGNVVLGNGAKILWDGIDEPFSSDFSSISSEVSKISSSVSQINQNIASIESRLDTNEENISALQETHTTDIDNLNNQISALNSDMDTAKKDIETLKLNQGGGSSITIDEIFGGEVTQDDIDNLFSA